MDIIDTIAGCTVKHEVQDSSKPLCVLGVLLTERGIKIREEMLDVLHDKFDLYVVEQPAPGRLFEYPALLYTKKLTQETGRPCLYLHTKGAGNHNAVQQIVRRMWYDELVSKIDKYLAAVDTATPTVACPYCSSEGVTWFNGFVVNKPAMELANITENTDRYYYEAIFSNENCKGVTVKGIILDNIEKANVQTMFNDMARKYGSLKLSALY